MSNQQPPVPGAAPQPHPDDRVMSPGVRPGNSWAEAMKLVTPQAGLAKDEPLNQPSQGPA